jgi:RNA polymerase sigma-70 factor, ECF subfamily
MALRADDVDLARDRTLVERYQAGDADAFDQLYRRYQQRLERFCLKRLGDRHEAEEVAQEAFVRALTALPRFEGERRFYPWVSVIASRLCVDTHRRRARAVPTREVDTGFVDGEDERILAASDVELLSKAVAQLGPRHREVLQFREVDGWSYERIADHYGVTLGTVESLLFRARKALKREFESLIKPESGLAGFPLVGWLIRRLHDWRSRVASADVGQWASGLSMAAVMSSAAILGTGAGVAAAAPPAAHSVVITATSVAHNTAAETPSATTAAPLVSNRGAATAAPPARPSAGSASIEQAREFTEEAPVQGHTAAGPVDTGLGLDPTPVVTTASSYLSQLEGAHL